MRSHAQVLSEIAFFKTIYFFMFKVGKRNIYFTENMLKNLINKIVFL